MLISYEKICPQWVHTQTIKEAELMPIIPPSSNPLQLPPSFGTLGSLILDVAIASGSITLFFYSLSLLYSTGVTVAGDKAGGAAYTPNGWQRRKQQPLEVGVSQIPRGLWKNICRRSYSSQYRAFPSFLFRPFASN